MDRELADGTVWYQQFETSDLSSLATERFTSLAPIVTHHDGSLHLQVAALGREFTTRLSRRNDSAAAEVLRLLDAALASGKLAPELENAVQISFACADDLPDGAAADGAFRHASAKLRELLSAAIPGVQHP